MLRAMNRDSQFVKKGDTVAWQGKVEVFFRDGRSPEPSKMVVEQGGSVKAKKIGTFTYDVRLEEKNGAVKFFRGGGILVVEPKDP